MKRLALLLLVSLPLANGCGKTRNAIAPGPPTLQYTFTDLDWVQGQYFLLYDPSSHAPLDVQASDIRLYLDDANASNDANTLRGKAMLDPDGALGQDLTSEQSSAARLGNFQLLTPGPGADYEVLGDLFAFHDTTYQVIRLTRPVPELTNQTVAVSYTGSPIVGPGHALGPPIHVGGRLVTSPGLDSGVTLLKMLRAPREEQLPTLDGFLFDPTAPWAPARELELKNIYALPVSNIDPASFQLTVQYGETEPAVTSQGGVPFVEMLGLDSWDERSGQPVPGHDGRIDAIGYNSQTRGRIDYANGVLYLPDFRPFAPRVGAPTTVAFDVFLDAHVNRRLRLGRSGSPSPSSPDPYALYHPRIFNATWYFVGSYPKPALASVISR